ncbi:uncharacterized protein RAG0_14197 [Rhynchosporium agropyri]|uniref:Uncharacterized protein n=1 Tax=Rhynchosporium agropyri TaxID=914238 RepID=A0A1E1LG78_9HELO|nr:uncharacterized protein RAG0_14197 [Rhynchosporium agropyri]
MSRRSQGPNLALRRHVTDSRLHDIVYLLVIVIVAARRPGTSTYGSDAVPYDNGSVVENPRWPPEPQ